MFSLISFWQFLSGLGLFLFGMWQLEEALKSLCGRTFKLFLREHTQNPFKSILIGIIATTILQSSSIVGLIILAFVGSGILHLHNAIGIILGSNLGTTLKGWIISYFGFKIDIESFALPLIAIGTLGTILLFSYSRWKKLFQAIMGLGLLFFGLNYMKIGVADLATLFDVSTISGQSLIVYFLFGFVLTAIIQSSSASMVITLTALNAGMILLPQAAALIIGADLGTTITLILGTLNGSTVKKQVAAAHFLFNLITDIIALILLFPLLSLLKAYSGIQDPLMLLVLFHSSFNFIGILIFFPFIKPFSEFLQKIFKNQTNHIVHLSKDLLKIPAAAIEALEVETRRFLKKVIELNQSPIKDEILKKYDEIKESEGQILDYAIYIQKSSLSTEETERLNQLLAACRYAVLSAKEKKDIRHNLIEYADSTTPIVHNFYLKFLNIEKEFYERIISLQSLNNQNLVFEQLVAMKQWNRDNFEAIIKDIYNHSTEVSDIRLSSLLNVNREIYDSNRSMIHAFKHQLLSPDLGQSFSNLPI